jgi:hypothetical protein
MLGFVDRLWSSVSDCHSHASLSQHCEVIQSIAHGKDLVGLYPALLAGGIHTCPLG